MSQQQPDRQDLDAARAQLGQARAHARRRFEALVATAGVQLSYAQGQLSRWRGEKSRLAAYAADPAQPQHNTYMSVELLVQAYTAMAAMQTLAIGMFEHNLRVLAKSETPAPEALRVPARSAAWVEQKRRMDLAMARYLMRFNARGVDGVLRATGHDGTITPVSDDHRAERAEDIGAIVAAAEASHGLGVLVAKLGGELAEVRRVNRWAITAFERWDAMDAAARLAFLRHPDWARLEALLPRLRELHEHCGAYQVLRARFVAWSPERPAFATAPSETAAKAPVGTLGGRRGQASELRLA